MGKYKSSFSKFLAIAFRSNLGRTTILSVTAVAFIAGAVLGISYFFALSDKETAYAATESNWAETHTQISGTLQSPSNAFGPTDNNWTTNPTDSGSWTSRFGMGTPSGSITGTQTIRVIARKNAFGTNDPTINSVKLFENGVERATLVGSTVITTEVSQTLTGTFNASLISDISAVQIEIVTTQGGGGPSTRRAVQLDSIEWEATLAVPGAPGTPTYTNVSTSSVRVNWTAGGGANYYKIERANDNSGTPGTFSQIATTTSLFYDNSGLTPNTTYWYRVRGTNDAGDGPYSDSSQIVLGVPSAVALNSPADTAEVVTATPTFQFTGTDPDGDDVAYNIQINASSLGTEKMWVTVGNGTENTIAYSSDGINWTGLGKSIFSNYGAGVAHNGSMWVAVGAGTNTIAYSSDGINWTGVTDSTSIFSNYGSSIAWNGSMWVAGGTGTNTIAYSSDGINWTGLGTSVFSTSGFGVAWNGSMWVATGNGTDSIAYSSDGINWTGVTGASIFSNHGKNVAWNGSMWVAVGSGTNTIAYSSDGINWTGLGTSMFSSDGNSIAWNGSMWVATGYGTTNTIAYSSDGINWTGVGKSIFSDWGNSIAWNGSMWVGAGRGTNTIAYSYDGINWTGLGTSMFSSIGNGVASAPAPEMYPAIGEASLWVAVGDGTTNSIAYSYDGINWTGLGKSIFSSIGWGAAHNGSMWVAVGNGTNTIAYSYDGINWTGLGTSIFSTNGYSVAWNGSMWVATGDSTLNSIAYSYDGINWTGLGTSIFSGYGAGVAWNGSMWVAVGNGTNTIAYSSDGINWTGATNSTSIFSSVGRGIAWGGSVWVAVGNGTNTIAYSYDGINWTGVGTTIFSTIGYGVAWNGEMWIAVGAGTNTIASSYDGINWTGLGHFTSILSPGRGVAWNGSMWVAVGNGTSNTIVYSYNGTDWTELVNSIFSTIGYGIASTPAPNLYPAIGGLSVLIDASSDDENPGFSGSPDNTDPFASGQQVSYTVQAGDALDNGTYYWRVRGKDPLGSNTYGEWSETRSFTVNVSGEPPTEFALTMAVSPLAIGTAQDTTGTSPYASGTIVSILATPNPGWEFVNWTASTGTFANANATSTTFEMPAQDVTVTANFQEVAAETYALTMVASSTAGGTAQDTTGTSPYASGTIVSILATPNPGWEFVNWTAPAGSFGNANATSTTFTMPAQIVTVTANFTEVIAPSANVIQIRWRWRADDGGL